MEGELKSEAMSRGRSSVWTNWTDDSEAHVWYPALYTSIVTQGSLVVPVYINDNGDEMNATLLAGVVGQKWDVVRRSLGTYVGWALYVADEPPIPMEEELIRFFDEQEEEEESGECVLELMS